MTAMLPPAKPADLGFRQILVSQANGDPYLQHRDAIDIPGRHVGVTLDRARCYPYRRA